MGSVKKFSASRETVLAKDVRAYIIDMLLDIASMADGLDDEQLAADVRRAVARSDARQIGITKLIDDA